MGQIASTALNRRRRSNPRRLMMIQSTAKIPTEVENEGLSSISDLPDECLACIFQFLSSGDRNRCSLVCRRWYRVDGQSRQRLSLDARSNLPFYRFDSVFSRFDSVSKLALKCDRRSVSIGDDALVLISLRCRHLKTFKLRACRQITDAGIAAFAAHLSSSLRKLSFGSCTFGAAGLNAVLDCCSALEVLSVKRLRGLADGSPAQPIGPGIAAASLKSICLKELYNGQCFGPLISGSKNLKTLKIFHCTGDWDQLLQVVFNCIKGVMEIHLERIQVSDHGLYAIAKCVDLETLHLVKTPECTDEGLTVVADHCKLLRRLHIDGWKTNHIGDAGLAAVAKLCPNIQELVLIGVNPTLFSLGILARNCRNLEQLALVGSDTIGDAEISCIAEKCVALKRLCIKKCSISNCGMEALAGGCPNLVKVKIKKCRGVTKEGVDWLRKKRGSLAISMGPTTFEQLDEDPSDAGAQENVTEQLDSVFEHVAGIDLASSSNSRPAFPKSRSGFLPGRNFIACTFRRRSHNSSSNLHNS